MKEMEKILAAVADGLKLLAQGLNSISEIINELSKEPNGEEKPEEKVEITEFPSKDKTTNTKKIPRKKTTQENKTKKERSGTASDAVFQIIKNSETGIGNAALAEKTGYDKKKVSNILHRLKKQGIIKSVGRGVYQIA